MFPAPFGLSPAAHKRAFFAALVTTLIAFLAMSPINAPLKTEAAPNGIVSWELARTLDRSLEMLASWDELTRLHAALGLGFDYVFMLAYGAALALGCGLIARGQRGWRRQLGVGLAWGALLAVALDAVENYALIRLLFGARRELWAELAFGCAAPKFALAAAGLLYVIAVPLWGRVRGSGR